MKTIEFFKYLIANFRAMPFVVQLALVIISTAVIFSVLSYIIMALFRFRTYSLERRYATLTPLISDLTFRYISPAEENNMDGLSKPSIAIVSEIKRFLGTRHDRQMMVELLVNYKKDLRGDMGDKLTELFIALGLDKFSLSKLQHSRNYKKIQALTELSDMGVTTSDVHILPLTQHSSHRVRTIARHSYIKLSKNDPFRFLDTSSDKLLIWDQIELFRIITSDETGIVPDIAPWLTYSTNSSVIHFCLRLVVQYNQRQAIPAVVGLLETRDHELRAAVINCLGKMKVTEVEQQLVELYVNQPIKCRIEIIKALGRMRTGNYVEFLKNEFIHSDDFATKKNAAKSLVNNLTSERIEKLLNACVPGDQVMIRYCMNPMIKYV
jgi:hypothetical protein